MIFVGTNYRFEDDSIGREAFEKYMNANYKNWMYDACVNSMKAVGTFSMDERCKDFPPHYLHQQVWSQMVDVFLGKQFRKSASQIKVNRMSTEDYATYTRGNTPLSVRVKRGKEKEKDFGDVYCDTYRTDGADVPAVVWQRVEKCREMVPYSSDAEGLDPSDTTSHISLPPFNREAWVEASGGIRKGTVAGFGDRFSAKDLRRAYGVLTSGSSTTASHFGSSDLLGLCTSCSMSKQRYGSRRLQYSPHRLQCRPHRLQCGGAVTDIGLADFDGVSVAAYS